MYVELHLVPNGDIVERTELAILFFLLFHFYLLITFFQNAFIALLKSSL